MEYRQYMHVERIGRDEVEGLLNGTVYIQPKIDGTNSVLWLGDDGHVHAGSRKRELSVDEDNAGFYAAEINDENASRLLHDHPTWYVYGEWLVKHTIKYYDNNSWRKFYVFDVFDAEKGQYLPYTEYEQIVREYGMNVIPVLDVLENPTIDDLTKYLDKNHYLIEDQSKIGEGIVCKNYTFKNRFGRTVWGKIIAAEFLGQKHDNHHHKEEVKNNICVAIADEYITTAMIEKEKAKAHEFAVGKGLPSTSEIGITLQYVWHSFLTEDIADAVKKFRNPVIDFSEMKKECDRRVKAQILNK